jgi:hypothetical protein
MVCKLDELYRMYTLVTVDIYIFIYLFVCVCVRAHACVVSLWVRFPYCFIVMVLLTSAVSK